MPMINSLIGATILAGSDTMYDVPAADRDSPAIYRIPLVGIGIRTSTDVVPEHGADVFRHRWTRPIQIAQLDRPRAEITGDAIYGGILGPQFGHVISQSTGRLWVCEHFRASTPIAFINSNPGFQSVPEYFVDLLRSLGIQNPVVLITRPTRIGRLHLGPDLCNLEHRPTADPSYLSWLARHQPERQIDPHLSIYVSRSRMGTRFGQFLQETLLEDAFQLEGYRVIYPETLPISEQISLYQRASRLIFSDGSAVHLWSLFASAEQKAAIVLRRPWLRNWKRWFRSFTLCQPLVLNRMIANFQGRGSAGRQPVAVLDMQGLWNDLAAAGFHSNSCSIGVEEEKIRQWLQDIEKKGDVSIAAPFELDAVSSDLLKTRRQVIMV